MPLGFRPRPLGDRALTGNPDRQASPCRAIPHRNWWNGSPWLGKRADARLSKSSLRSILKRAADPEIAVRLIYEEFCLRQEAGEEVGPDELLRRFPQWRSQLEVVLDCHKLLQPRQDPPVFPSVGEPLGEFQLLAELGRGAEGRVFLATQPSLSDRPVVVKLVPRKATSTCPWPACSTPRLSRFTLPRTIRRGTCACCACLT